MKYDTPVGRTLLDEESGPVGKPLDRVDGRLKVTGRATYAAEYAGEGTAVYGYVVQATIAKGRITAIDTSAAEQMPGVLLVLTYRNASPPGGQGPRTPDGPPARAAGACPSSWTTASTTTASRWPWRWRTPSSRPAPRRAR